MNQNSRTLSIIAYYLSEYDLDAVHALGYRTRSEAFKQISALMERDNNYLKLRRDEFDALPDSSSNRNGWKNRLPANDVVSLAVWLKDFNFAELSEMVNKLIFNTIDEQITTSGYAAEVPANISENEFENLINMQDSTATIKIREGTIRTRVYNTSIIAQLKKLYRGNCQICGSAPFTSIKTDITEAHHIDYFSKSQNNNASNLIILCPNHHRLIHKLNPIFDNSTLAFIFDDGHSEKIKLNYHVDNNVAEDL